MNSGTRPLAALLLFIALAAFLSVETHASGYIPSGPASLSLSSFYVPRTISYGAPLAISGTIGNGGGLAISNITVRITVSGAGGAAAYSYLAGPLSPMQNESFMITAHPTLPPGPYTVSINASSPGSSSPAAHWSYQLDVLNSGQQAAQPQGAQPHRFMFSYLPIYMSVTNGSEQVFNIGIRNTNSSPETIDLGIPSNLSSMAILSSKSEYLQPGATVYVQMLVNAHSSGNITSYSIPLGVSVYNGISLQGTSSYPMRLVVFSKATPPAVLETVALENSSTLSGTVELLAGGNTANATLVTQLPMVDGLSGIHTYGLPARTEASGAYYYIYWSVPQSAGNQSVYAYYTASYNSTSLPYATRFTALSQPSPNEEIRIINFSLPTFYTDSTGSIAVEALYTGTRPDTLDLYVSAPPGVSVINSTQAINVTPNQLVTRRFTLETGSTAGTLILTMYITSSMANITYSLPVIVLQKGQLASGATPGSPGSGGQTMGLIASYAPYAGAAVLIGILIYAAILVSNRPRYNSRRAKKLMAIKEELRKNL